jgi:hypothetical protein
MRFSLLILCSLMVGCNSPSVLKGSGEVAPAPYGFTIYCQQNPDRAECGGTK